MKQITFLKWVLEINVQKTKAYYQAEEICDCQDCMNYKKACNQLPASLVDIFLKLGIEPGKPNHLCSFGDGEDGNYHYIGNYHLVGRLIEGDMMEDDHLVIEKTAVCEFFTFWFEKDLLFVKEEQSKPILQLGFEVNLPWVIEQKYENE